MDEKLYVGSGIAEPYSLGVKEEEPEVKDSEVVKNLIGYFEGEVKRLESISSISQEVLNDPTKFMHVVAGNKIGAQNAYAALNYLNDFIADTKD